MEHQLNLQNFKKKEIHRMSDRFYGKSEDGKELSFNNYYMENLFSASAESSIIPEFQKTSGKTPS